MPKMKTNRAAAKRFKITGSGKKAKFGRANKRHLLEHKSAGTRRKLGGTGVVNESDMGRLKRLLPYG